MEWRRCISSLGARKSTDRIRGLKKLTQLLDSDDAMEELCTSEDEIISFNEVYESFHEVLVKEAVRAHSKVIRVTVPSTSCNVMNAELKRVFGKLVSKASQDKFRVTTENLIASLNQVFSSPYLRSNFGALYYSSVVSTLLKKRTYWGEISGKGWRDLLRISVIAYSDQVQGLDQSKVAKYLAFLISQGSLNCELSIWIAGKYGFVLDMVMQTSDEVMHTVECIMMLALSFATKVAKENRELACKFGERALGRIVLWYNPCDSEIILLKSLVLEFMLFQMNIHHPNGALKSCVSAYAHDSQLWERRIRQMFELLKEEILENNQKIPSSHASEPLRGRFIMYAVEVLHQIINLPREMSTDEEKKVPSGEGKEINGKKEVSPHGEEKTCDEGKDLTTGLREDFTKGTGLQLIIDLVKESPDDSLWCWLYIISVLIRKYQCIEEQTYMSLLEYLTEFISLARSGLTLDCFYRCCRSLAEVTMPVNCDPVCCVTAWQKIWDKAIWAIGLKQSEVYAQETICALMAANLLHTQKHVTELFNMFLVGNLSPYEGSIKILHRLLMSYNVVDEMEAETRETCLLWVYPVKEKLALFQKVTSVELIAEILAQLCVRENIRKVPPKRVVKKCAPLEHFYIQLQFCDGILMPGQNPPRGVEFTSPDDMSLESSTVQMFCKMVTHDSESLVTLASEQLTSSVVSDSVVTAAGFISYQLQVLMLVASYFIKWKVSSPTSEEILSILDSSKKMLETLTDLVEAHVKSQRSPNELMATFTNLASLYEVEVDDHISHFLRDYTPTKLINVLMNVIKDQAESLKHLKPRYMKSSPDRHFRGMFVSHIDYYSILDPQIFEENIQLIIIGCRIMGSFCCMYGGKTYTTLQRQALIYFLSNLPRENSGIGLPLRLQMLMEFVFLPMNRMAISVSYLSVVLSILQKILSLYSNDVELLQIIISILEEVTVKAINDNSIQEVACVAGGFYLEKMYKCIVERKLPSVIAVKIVKLIGCLIKINPDLTWPWLLDASDRQITLSEFLLQELDSPYAEVRMVVAENVHSMLYPIKFERCAAQNSNLDLLMKYIINTCSEELTVSVVNQRRSNFLRVAVHCLCVVAVTTSSLRKTALYYILKIVTSHRIGQVLGKKILTILGEELQTDSKALVCSYLQDFLEKWVTLDNFEDFPYWLAYNSREEFFIENTGDIFSILWIANHDYLNNFCNAVGKSPPELLKDHASLVIALLLCKDLSDASLDESSSGRQTAHNIIDQLMKMNASVKMYEVLSAWNDPFLYHMFKLCYDEEKFSEIAGNKIMINCSHVLCYPEKSLMYFTKDMILKAINYISCLNKESGRSFLDYIIVETPGHFRTVLHLLAGNVINSPTACDALTALAAFQSFVEVVLSHINESQGRIKMKYRGQLVTGLIRDVTFSLIRIIRRWSRCTNDTVYTIGFLFLCEDLEKHFLYLMEGLKVILVPLIYALVDLIKDGCVKEIELEVLKLIERILELDYLKNDLACLMPFPRTPTFQYLNVVLEKTVHGGERTTLRMDLKNFIGVYSMLGIARPEMLQYVQTMLMEKKDDMKELYEEIENKNYSFYHYSETTLHRTIRVLTMLSTTSDYEIRCEAAKCLAEIATGDIKAGILIPQRASSILKSMAKNPLHRLTYTCLELLPKYLIDLDVEVVEATSKAICAIVNSKEGGTTLREHWPSQMKLAHDYAIVEKMISVQISPSPLEFKEEMFNEANDLWIPSGDCDHSKWITALVTTLLRCFTTSSSYLEKLVHICSLKVPFCEEIFPFILELFLKFGEISCESALFKQVKYFFKACYNTFSSRSVASPPETEIMRSKAAVVTMLNAVNYLNLQHHGIQMKISDDDDAIDYLHCAVAALHCSAFFSAIQYCSLWISRVSKGNEAITLEFHIKAKTPDIEEILQVLRESHAGLGDKDGLYGCGTSHLLEPQGRIEHYKNLDKWVQVMRSYELELSGTCDQKSIDGLLMSLQMLGMEEMLMGLVDAREQEEILEFKYESAWRLGSWSLLSKFAEKKKHSCTLFLLDDMPKKETIFQVDTKKINAEFHRNLFLAIRSIRNGKYTEAMNELVCARGYVMSSMSLISLEACQSIYKPVCRLHALKEIEEFASAFKTKKENALPFVLSQWEQADVEGEKHFKTVEPIKALRLTLLKYCCLDNNRRAALMGITNAPIKAVAEVQLKLGRSAREAGLHDIAEKYLRAVREIPTLQESPLWETQLKLEEAQLLWARGDADVAQVIIRSAVDCLDYVPLDKPLARVLAEALTVRGHWVMKTHSEKAKVSLCKYFGRAMDVLNDQRISNSSPEYLSAIRAMAAYADEQYIMASKYVGSESYAKKQRCASQSMYVVSDYQGARGISTDEKRSLMLLEKQAKLDEIELEECESEKSSYLEVALSYYIKFLKYSPQVDLDVVFRFVSLFLENHSDEDSLYIEVETIPSYKFIPVILQLLPRIVQSRGKCSRTLKNIVENCAVHHPHHVLPHILALAYSLQELDKTKGSDAFITETQKENQRAAKRMVSKLRKDIRLTEHVTQLTSLWEALISLAYLPVNDVKIHQHTMGPKVLLRKIKSLTHVQIPTVALRESPTGEYNIISVESYLPQFTLVGGINVPKKITCLGSDGKTYPQLLKGRDDLRQDAVMQQVFHLMNTLLRQDENTSERKLRIRTYLVVPLSHRSGIIEWCTTTTSIGNYLHGFKTVVGAHTMYNPSDYLIRTCKHMMQEVHKSTKKIKLQVFLEICENLQPVFRHYFFSRYPNPGVWYEMRQAYTRSVATSSIIGYVLGLGDRHLQNILIDETTAEVLHVDLGIAFEQGMTLTTPETIPFRLTRDIVDGMGISGVEGVFRRSCEATMGLMRKHHQIILTVLEVLIYDPLYAWTLKPKFKMMEAEMSESRVTGTSTTTPSAEDEVVVVESASLSLTSSWSALGKRSTSSARSKPSTSKNPESAKSSASTGGKTNYSSLDKSTQGAERNAIAVRALERLEHKLLGTEDSSNPSSVEAQVERLILEAQDPENLCVLYPGWQPYL